MCTRMRHVRGFLLGITGAMCLSLGSAAGWAQVESGNQAGPCALTDRERESCNLRSPKEAIGQVQKVLGLKDSVTLRSTAELVTLQKDNTPYLSGDLVGRLLWHVVVDRWSVDLQQSRTEARDRYVRILDVYLDPVDGQVRKVASRWPKGEPPMPPTVNAMVAAEQMKNWGEEIYHGFPSDPPEVTFFDALVSIDRAGWDPTIAKQIVAEYVIWSRMGEKPRAVWAVMLRGVPMFKPPPGVQKDFQDQYRYIIDAETGKFLVATNTPHPEKRRAEDD